MSQRRLDESLWFEHRNGTRLYPWWRHAKERNRTAFWVSDGSNLIENADPVESIEALIHAVFGRGRSVWLRSKGAPAMSGLYRLGGQVIHAWGATGAVRPLVDAALRGVRPAGKASRGSSPREKPRVSAEALAAALKADLAKVGATEREAIVKQRVGQLVFREALLDLWDGKCAVTGLAIPDLLRASHAKPWTDCTSKAERLDPFNGLLLAPHLDALFDRGYVTFDDRGKGVWSAEVSPAALAALGLAGATPVLRWIDPRHAPYLAYHREHVFRGARDVHTTGQ